MAAISRYAGRILLLLMILTSSLLISKPALAFANIEICNTGELDFQLAKVDSIESFFGRSILLTGSGWYEFPSGKCDTLGFDNYIWLGITATNEHGQMGAVMLHSVTIEEKVDQEQWKRIADIDLATQYEGDAYCVHPTEDFEIRTQRNSLQSECPEGYYLMPFIDETCYKGPCCGIIVRELNIRIPRNTSVFPFTPAQAEMFNQSGRQSGNVAN